MDAMAVTATRRRAGLPSGWLTRERAIAYAGILALTEFVLFALCVAGTHGLIVPLSEPTSTDFVSFHAAGALADHGTAWLAYDRTAHHLAEQAAVGAAIGYNYFYYPPVFLLLCAPLAWLPYLPAFVAFQVAGGVALWGALRLIRRDTSPAVLALLLLAFPGFWWAIGTGQNALLTAALFAAGTALLDRRPWFAGICFGLLCYKPHFGLLLPVALLAGEHWRAVLAAGATVVVLVLASLALFGAATWQAFLAATGSFAEVYASHAIFMAGLTSGYGAALALGASRQAAFALQAVLLVVAVAAVIAAWRVRDGRAAPLPVRAAVLLAATPVAVPVLMFYDLMLVLVALLWLSRVVPLPWSRGRTLVALLVFVGPLLSGNLLDGAVPVACIVATLNFGLVVTICRGWLAPPRRVTDAALSGAA